MVIRRTQHWHISGSHLEPEYAVCRDVEEGLWLSVALDVQRPLQLERVLEKLHVVREVGWRDPQEAQGKDPEMLSR